MGILKKLSKISDGCILEGNTRYVPKNESEVPDTSEHIIWGVGSVVVSIMLVMLLHIIVKLNDVMEMLQNAHQICQ